ncbi:MAG TPA: oligosaccharide flippase family protein, partial [Clostridiaceae bacterium]|nr:oligosaccharide flippase family protein [Clostridiaceae bacterium]
NGFNNVFLKFQRTISIIVFPLGVGVFLFSDLATKILLGNKWLEATRVIGLWALTSAILIVFGHLCSEVYRAKGRPKLSFLAQVLHLVVLVPACIISAQYGFWALVQTRAWIRVQLILVHLILMKVAIDFPIMGIFRNVFPTGFSAIVMGIAGYLLRQAHQGVLWDLASVIICVIVYFSVLLSFPRMRKEFFSLSEMFLKKKGKAEKQSF